MVKQSHLFFEDEAIKLLSNEYNLGFVDGRFGSGKTAFLAYIANDFKDNYDKIYSNFHLNLDNAIYLDKIDREIILDLNDGYEDGDIKSLMVLQESYNYFDKRECMKKANKGIQTALFQIRKMGIDILADIPKLEYLDFRSQENGTMFFHSLGRLEIGGIKTDRFLYQSINFFSAISDKIFTIEMTELFKNKIYKTMEKTKIEEKDKDKKGKS